MDYFRANPRHLFLKELEGDPQGRSFVAALMQGGAPSGKTVILLNHFDVEDTGDYGELADLAFCPLALAQALKKLPLAPAVRKDLSDGNYLFGRGTADMKAGIALQLALLQHFSIERDSFPGNLLFLSVPDEEHSSRGALESLPFLDQLRAEYGLIIRTIKGILSWGSPPV